MVVAQEQDSMGGSFSARQAFIGSVMAINFWNRSLTEKEIPSSVSPEHANPDGTLISIKSNWVMKGHRVKKITKKLNECQLSEKKFYKFTLTKPFQEAKRFLEEISLTFAIPETKNERICLISMMKREEGGRCSLKYSAEAYSWVGIDYNQSFADYSNFSNEPFSILNSAHKRKGESNQMYVVLSSLNFFYYSPEDKKLCFIGQSKDSRILFKFYLRDEHEYMTEDFTLADGEDNYYFISPFSYTIKYESINKSWIILDDVRGQNHLVALSYGESIPIGNRQWLILDQSICPSDLMDNCEIGAPLTGTLTKCQKEDFTCDNGQCVDIEYRCNMMKDCSDWSDEAGCSLVRLHDSYLSNLPPYLPISIEIRIEIKNIQVGITVYLWNFDSYTQDYLSLIY